MCSTSKALGHFHLPNWCFSVAWKVVQQSAMFQSNIWLILIAKWQNTASISCLMQISRKGFFFFFLRTHSHLENRSENELGMIWDPLKSNWMHLRANPCNPSLRPQWRDHYSAFHPHSSGLFDLGFASVHTGKSAGLESDLCTCLWWARANQGCRRVFACRLWCPTGSCRTVCSEQAWKNLQPLLSSVSLLLWAYFSTDSVLLPQCQTPCLPKSLFVHTVADVVSKPVALKE